MRPGRITEVGPDRATRSLFRALAERCRDRTAVLAPGAASAAALLRGRAVDAVELEIDAAGRPGVVLPAGEFGTALVLGVLEALPEEAAQGILSRAWALLRPGGRLLVVVPHGDGVRHADDVRAFRRRELARMLRPLGKAETITEQPFRWLVMAVRKPRDRARRPPRARLYRYRVTARLCRGRVIELGCGEGYLTKLVHDRGLEAVGVDLSRSKIERARETHRGPTFIAADIVDLALPDASFDTAVLAEVLEHVPEPTGDAMLERAWRLLRPGGRLIVSVPYEDCVPHRNHIRRFDRRGLQKILRRFDRPRLVADQPFKWLLAYVQKPPASEGVTA